ncbi:MAG: hypothetical protein BAJALOKI3v1_210034 [Promethearchaeota archaeon]|nr:MAG: hypothetical protein BAJALOKI3v1_210034 [Candidatus Lokiarchaeota archaeon]
MYKNLKFSKFPLISFSGKIIKKPILILVRYKLLLKEGEFN